MKIGYARVSTAEQNLDLQRDALKAAGCEKVITEFHASGIGTAREIDSLLKCCLSLFLIVHPLPPVCQIHPA